MKKVKRVDKLTTIHQPKNIESLTFKNLAPKFLKTHKPAN